MSSPPKLILDTCALRDRHFINWLCGEYHGEKTVSPVAYMEYARQLIANGKDIESINRMLNVAGITVGTFAKKDAIVAAKLMGVRDGRCPCCNKIDWADTMIYSSIGCPPTLLVTYNIADYPLDDRVITPKEVMIRYKMKR